MLSKYTVLDFFCGAGGFSEGFRQQGFKIAMGVDNWRPAVETHNLNHGLNDSPIDILRYEDDIEAIDLLPNTEVIVGSPPCVDFSMSNRAGKAYKGMGIRLIETMLRIVAVKKHQSGSKLKVWLLENVPNSQNYIKDEYTFEDLGLGTWAKKRWPKAKDPASRVALKARFNGHVLNAANYGSPQNRKRFICGEISSTGEFPMPVQTHSSEGVNSLRRYVWLADIRNSLPSPANFDKYDVVKDPNYPSLTITSSELTDHFYDTGLYRVEWEKAKAAKLNHPYMGKMAFPEDENRTARTVMATRSASTREALIFGSEYSRTGDGEFRLPTIREIATLMGFPFTYQFLGSEGTKWRLVGNAVCPHLSSAFASAILTKVFKKKNVPVDQIEFDSLKSNYRLVNNLNSNIVKEFSKPPKRNKGAKFREHPFKKGNITVALMNHLPEEPDLPGKKWHAVMFFGAGSSYQSFALDSRELLLLDSYLKEWVPSAEEFSERVKNELLARVPDADTLQVIFENNEASSEKMLRPSDIVLTVDQLISQHNTLVFDTVENFRLNGFSKNKMPVAQILAAWAISLVSAKINQDEVTLKALL